MYPPSPHIFFNALPFLVSVSKAFLVFVSSPNRLSWEISDGKHC